jgi:4-diphosphocytidyl-2C-methyl-D-erythritol kinase
MQLQALEERNKSRLQQIFTSKRGEITGYRRATSQVNAYYQAMTGMGSGVNSVMDRKK